MLCLPEIRSPDVFSSVSTSSREWRRHYNAREYLVGHRHSIDMDIHYDRTTEQKRLVEFCKAIPLLTMDPSQRLKQENQELSKDYFAS